MAFFGRYIEVTPHSRIVCTNEESADGAVSTVTFEEKGRTLSLKASPRRRYRLWNREGAGEQFEQLDTLLVTLVRS